MIYSVGATDIGCVRESNEDSYIILEPALYALSDGMGGHNAGEVASQMIITAVKKLLLEHLALEPEKRPRLDSQWLKKAISIANADIYQEAKLSEAKSGMGATATLLHIEESEERAYFASIGDSRIYLLREDNFEQLTKDDSYVYSLVKAGKISEEEASHHPMKNVLLKAVGMANEDLDIEVGELDIIDGDIFILTSDGLTNMVADDVIKEVLKSNKEQGVDTLISMARENGGDDNITVIIAKYKTESKVREVGEC